jgi:hypothetical protein
MAHQEFFDSEALSLELLNTFTDTMAARKGAIMSLIQAEAGTNLLDKKIADITPVHDKKKNKPQKNTNGKRQNNEFK